MLRRSCLGIVRLLICGTCLENPRFCSISRRFKAPNTPKGDLDQAEDNGYLLKAFLDLATLLTCSVIAPSEDYVATLFYTYSAGADT